MKRSILFKLWTFPGSYETFLVNQIGTAITCGYDVKILLKDTNYLKNSRHKDLIEELQLENKLIISNYKIPSSKFFRIIKSLILIIRNVHRLRPLLNFLKEHRKFELINIYKFHFYKKLTDYDIIHVQYGTNAKPLDILKKTGVLKSRLIVSFHGHDLHFPINNKIHELNYYNNLFLNADILTVNTPYLKTLLLKYNAPQEKIKVIPVGVDTEFFIVSDQKKRTDIFKIITVGRLDKLKGQVYGIETAKILRDSGYNFTYTIVGDGPEFNFLSQLIKKYDLENYVTMIGEKSRSEVRDLLKSHDIFLMTSVAGPRNAKEAQGLVTAEAQASGLPVIAFDSGGVKYTIKNGETGFLAPEGDTRIMMNYIKTLIQNDQLLDRMSQAAVKYVDMNFAQKKINKTWQEVYNALVD
ncbi:colanic acid/amylovoran biosynthesis glycosyltransferase [Salegentibacter sp. 24]|uniref:glycosyltransferase n=1 Tax=Salegentibacter sp. 24 TaxID=2183986 RepID=UPI00105B72D1|nr:glycosyltransferase [Salegentibacter sp. 24]TDN89151.1 colanic acid/amylovoran biosynthesis glycosyltransferase [Salegentibacter sp. 24]